MWLRFLLRFNHLALDLQKSPDSSESRAIEYTDFPEGLWKFFLVYDGEHCVLMVPSDYLGYATMSHQIDIEMPLAYQVTPSEDSAITSRRLSEF